MRPDRLLIGEVREAEALDLLIAMNSGLPGRRSNLPSAFLVLPHTAQRIAAYPPPNHPCRWVEPSLRGRRPGPRESSPSKRRRALRSGRMSQSGGGGRRAVLGMGTLRESQARRGHPQPPTQVPLPRHSHDGHTVHHGLTTVEVTPRPPSTRVEGTPAASPFNGGHRAHPRIALGTASATAWGEQAASPRQRALPPGHSRRLR